MKALFGTDGNRGEAGQFPLDTSTVSAIGFSLGSHLGTTSQIIIGRDTRESGASIERALIEGANKAGAQCLSAGVITTPGVAFLTRKHEAAAGVVISASHNPYKDNGIKIFAPSGQKMDDSVERLIESDIFAHAEQRASLESTATPPTPELEKKLQQQYFSFLVDEIGKGLALEGLTIVVDCAN